MGKPWLSVALATGCFALAVINLWFVAQSPHSLMSVANGACGAFAAATGVAIAADAFRDR